MKRDAAIQRGMGGTDYRAWTRRQHSAYLAAALPALLTADQPELP